MAAGFAAVKIPLMSRKQADSGAKNQIAPREGLTWLTRLAFALALVAGAARALVLQFIREPFAAVPSVELAPRAAGPATALLLDLFCWLPLLLVLARGVLDQHYRVRWTLAQKIMVALGGWMALSIIWSADRFAAMISAADFVSMLALVWALSQTTDTPRRLRLLVAGVFALLLAYVACGLEYRLVDLPELRQQFLQNREQILRERGMEPGAFAARQFEQKVLAGDLGCFASSPNSYAAALLMMSLATAGLAIQRWRDRDATGWVLALLAPLPLSLLMIWFAHSRTSMLMVVGGILLFGATGLLGGWLSRRWRLAYWIGVGGFLLASLAVIGHGWAHGSLLEKSLTFRWYYWTGAAKLVHHWPITGVGWANFGQFYPQVRGVLATEEVQDPHNFIVRFFVELGLVGGLLLIAWMARLWWELIRPSPAPMQDRTTTHRGMRSLIGLGIVIAAVQLLATVDLAADPSWVTLQVIRRIVLALILVVGLAIVAMRSLQDESMDARPAPWARTGLLIALGVFLLQNLIDFAMFESGPMFVFALVLGGAWGARLSANPQPNARGRMLLSWISFGIALVVWIGVAILWARTAGAEMFSRAADRAVVQSQFDAAQRRYAGAFDMMPMNGEYAYRAATAAAYAQEPLSIIDSLTDQAIAANPRRAAYHLFNAQLQLAQANPDVAEIMTSFDRAIRLDPQSVQLRLDFARALQLLGKNQEAIDQYSAALKIDEQLPADEPKRLSAERRREIETTLARLRSSQ